MDEAIGKKIDDYLTKPVNPAQILAACKKFLETKTIEQDKLTQDYFKGFNEITQKLYEPLEWNDWKELYLKLVNWSIELDRYPDLGFYETLQNQWRECNSEFSKFIENNYKAWLNAFPDELFHPGTFASSNDKYLFPLLKNDKPTFFFVVVYACRPMANYGKTACSLFSFNEFICSILPTATPYARNSIFSGFFCCYTKILPQWWSKE
jgi:hypothetical protein